MTSYRVTVVSYPYCLLLFIAELKNQQSGVVALHYSVVLLYSCGKRVQEVLGCFPLTAESTVKFIFSFLYTEK